MSSAYLVGGLVEMLLDVVERMLRNIGDPQVGMPPHDALHRLHLACDIATDCKSISNQQSPINQIDLPN